MAHPAIKRLNARHYHILGLFLNGFSIPQVAKEVNMSSVMIKVIYNSPSFQHQLALRQQRRDEIMDNRSVEQEITAKQLLKQSAVDAACRLIEGIDSENDKLAVKCASDILDRTGHERPTSARQSPNVAVVISTPDADLIRESLAMSTKPVESIQSVKPAELLPSSDSGVSTGDTQPQLGSTDQPSSESSDKSAGCVEKNPHTTKSSIEETEVELVA